MTHSNDPLSHLDLSKLTDAEVDALLYDWTLWARPEQLPPQSEWRTWLILAGRGFGKSRTGAEWVRRMVETNTYKRIAIVGPTAADVRDVMIEGESGILACSPPWCRPTYEPTKRRLTYPNGAIVSCFSADEPDRLRGPQNEGAWCDEIASWRYPEAYDQLMFGMRLGTDPRVMITTTPRPTPLIRRLVTDPMTHVTRGRTSDNADNLAPSFMDEMQRRYAGTRLGRQELNGEILDDVVGALWTLEMLDAAKTKTVPDLVRIVVAVDPATTSNENSDETGIIVAGIDAEDNACVIEDCSLKASPEVWARTAIDAYKRHNADRIVAEGNQGGDLIESMLRTIDPTIPYKKVHASRGKIARAEPVVALYEQGRVKHLGYFEELEEQMLNWVYGKPSPDRLDALTWAIHELMLSDDGVEFSQIVEYYDPVVISPI